MSDGDRSLGYNELSPSVAQCSTHHHVQRVAHVSVLYSVFIISYSSSELFIPLSATCIWNMPV